ncbi:rhodanese-like domain-containing protein [Rhizobium sullae]|uniref:Rhodanese-like domain-containing protein n=1 Tax=Rhizobium sullae TaxID=50338 RepID=A0A4R3PWD8_RHISU|nr:rhodanese-like domain-containing protein [Rhizobium sullae]
MSLSLPGSLVSTESLAAHLDHPDFVILDGSFKLPGVTPVAAEDFAARHIPNARFFDIDDIADHETSLPHMLPSADAFERYASNLGISNDSTVVVYDTPGLMSAGRVWWTLRTFGHDKVAVLDGGLRKWLAEGRPITNQVTPARKGHFHASFHPDAVRSKAQVLGNLHIRAEQVIDARSAAKRVRDCAPAIFRVASTFPSTRLPIPRRANCWMSPASRRRSRRQASISQSPLSQAAVPA